MVKGGLSNVMNTPKKTLENLRDNIKKHKIFAAVAGVGAAAAGVAAGAAIHHKNHNTKKVKKSEVLALTDQANKTMIVIDNATGNVETIITGINFTATAAAVATANSSSDKGKAVNDTANSIIDKIPVLREICDFIRKILDKIRDAIQHLFAKPVSGTVSDPKKEPDTPEKNPASGPVRVSGTVAEPNKKLDTPEKNPALGAGKVDGTVAEACDDYDYSIDNILDSI